MVLLFVSPISLSVWNHYIPWWWFQNTGDKQHCSPLREGPSSRFYIIINHYSSTEKKQARQWQITGTDQPDLNVQLICTYIFHLSSTPIQILQSLTPVKMVLFRWKLVVFPLLAPKIKDPWHPLEPPRRGSSNECTQTQFQTRGKEMSLSTTACSPCVSESLKLCGRPSYSSAQIYSAYPFNLQ